MICDQQEDSQHTQGPGYVGIVESGNAKGETKDCNVWLLCTFTSPSHQGSRQYDIHRRAVVMETLPLENLRPSSKSSLNLLNTRWQVTDMILYAIWLARRES